MTVEGENDDISGIGQTSAAHRLCVNMPDAAKVRYIQPKVGHYGVFNGSRFRAEIAPRIADFIRTHAGGIQPAASKSTAPSSIAKPNGKPNGAHKTPAAAKPVARGKSASARKDDLTRISGIGPKLAEKLNARGIATFRQIAELTDKEIAALDKALGFPGRIGRDKWVAQARRLVR
jgi:poly(3-hydroxybutyrate) depolymerase